MSDKYRENMKIQDGGLPPFWKWKICNKSAANRQIFTKFCKSTYKTHKFHFLTN